MINLRLRNENQTNLRINMLTILELQRNDKCICFSGKKYKKCCLDKHNAINDFKDIIVTGKQISPEDYQDGRAALPIECLALFEKIDSFEDEIMDKKYVLEVLAILEKMHKETSYDPVIVFYMYVVNNLLGNIENAKNLLDMLSNKYPQYVYGRIQCAANALQNNKPTDAFTYIKEDMHSLKDLAPTRTIFHIEEALFFHKVLIRIAMYRTSRENMRRHYNNLVHIKMHVPEAANYQDFVTSEGKIIRKFNFQLLIHNIENREKNSPDDVTLETTENHQSEL